MIDTTALGQLILIVIVSYVLGSVPTAYLIGRLNRVNIFEIGSGNMGGTNVIRALGLGWGILVLAIDILKGIGAILLATHIAPDYRTLATVVAAIAVVIGHNWSLLVAVLTGRLRGGKGAATAFGTVLMIAPLHLIAAICIIGALVVALTRYVSLGVLVMMVVSFVWALVLIGQDIMPWEYGIYAIGIAAMILWRFRGNIQRLLAGTERRIGERA